MAAKDRAAAPGKSGASSIADGLMRASLSAVAPGTALRDGLERILRGNTGGLIVLGMDKTVESMCTGGFVLDVEFTATRLRELCKLDGALILDKDITKILRAGVQLVPDASIPTEETGTRHRTADRVSMQSGFPVVSVSQSMRLIALYVDGQRRVLEDSGGDPVPGEPGAGHAGAVQAAARRGRGHAVGAGDRGPGHGPRRDGGRAAAGDGPPDRDRDRRVRGRAGHGRAAALAPAGRADRGRRAGAGAGRPGLRAGADGEAFPHGRRGAAGAGRADAPRAAGTADRGAGAGVQRARRRRWTRRSPRGVTGCWRRCRGCRGRSSSGWWSTSAACRSCSRRASTTCRRWTAWARPGPARSARASPGWRSPRSWSGTCSAGGARPSASRAAAGFSPSSGRTSRRAICMPA